MRRPFELAVELARGHQDRQFAQPAAEPRLVPQVTVQRPGMARQRRAVQVDAARAAQAAQRGALRVGEAVVDPLPLGIELVAPRQGQPALRLRIDILRVGSTAHSAAALSSTSCGVIETISA